jgi:hypothetical protein
MQLFDLLRLPPFSTGGSAKIEGVLRPPTPGPAIDPTSRLAQEYTCSKERWRFGREIVEGDMKYTDRRKGHGLELARKLPGQINSAPLHIGRAHIRMRSRHQY